MKTTRELMDAIPTKFAKKSVGEKCDCIFWKTPVIHIQNILLDTPPPREVRSFDGVRSRSTAEYAKVMKLWKKKYIGGSVTFTDKLDGKYWNPPEKASLHSFPNQETASVPDTYEVYLLQKGESLSFLLKESGINNSLMVLSKKNKDVRVWEALRRINALLE